MSRTGTLRRGMGVRWAHRKGLARATRASRSSASAAPLVLILPPGGFGWASNPDLMDPAAAVARDAGLRPIVVHYPVRDPQASWRHVLAVTKRIHPAFAYGESAGGTLGGRLAQLGLIERAALNAPISNLFTWRFPGWKRYGLKEGWELPGDVLDDLSPIRKRSVRPIDIFHSRGDEIVPFADSVEWASHDPAMVTLTEVEDPHIHGPTYQHKLELAFGALVRGAPATA